MIFGKENVNKTIRNKYGIKEDLYDNVIYKHLDGN